MNNNNFIPRKFEDQSKNFDEFIHDYNISIILGETGSGKTYLFKNYYERHKDSSKYIELVALDYEEVIDKQIEVVLLDSIDEALYHNPSDKILKKKLSNYILKCREINENVKFVIACRYSEWKSLYEDEFRRINPTQPQQLEESREQELKLWKKENSTKAGLAGTVPTQRQELENKYKDRSVKRYDFDVLSEKDLENILLERRVDREVFWKFITVNQLRRYDSELKFYIDNAQMIIKFIDNFERYQNKELKYYEIYHAIIENHLLAETDNERKILLQKLSLEEMINTVSCIAYHMVKNSTPYIFIEETYEILVNEKLEGLKNANISIDKLKTILNTSLFKGFNFNIDKSMTNYLVAYFINKNGIDPVQTCVHELDIIERFKDAFVHLLHLDLELFSKILEINPFVFKQHYTLDESQQKKLLENILVVFQEKKYLLEKHEQDYLNNNNALTRFDKIDNLEEVLKEKIDIKKLDKELYHYILLVTEINCTEIQTDSILLYFWKKIYKEKGKTECKEILIYQFEINNSHHNKKLFSFLKEHELFDNAIDINSLEFKLLEFFLLEKQISTENFFYLIGYVPTESFKEISLLLDQSGLDIWFKYIEENHEKIEFEIEYITSVIYGVLNALSSKELLLRISSFLEKYHINLDEIPKVFRWTSSLRPKNYYDYEKNLPNIFELYFTSETLATYPLLYILELNDDDIKKVLDIYPVEEYIEKYRQLINIPKAPRVLREQCSKFDIEEKKVQQKLPKIYSPKFLKSNWGDDEDKFEAKPELEEEIDFDINTSLDEFIKEYEEQQTPIKFFIDDLKQKINPSGHIGINPLRDKRKKYIESNINREKLKKLIFLSYSNSNEDEFIRNNEFEISSLWKYFNKEDLEELSSSDNDRVVTEANKRLVNIYNDENKEIETIYKEIIKNDKTDTRPLIITEGKTDWKHLEKALNRFQKDGFFTDLNVEFRKFEYVSMSASELDGKLKGLSKGNFHRTYIGVFDRDLLDYTKEYDVNSEGFIQVIDKELINRIKYKLIDHFSQQSPNCQDDITEDELKKFCKKNRIKYKRENKDKILKEFHAKQLGGYNDLMSLFEQGSYRDIDRELKRILTYDIYDEWKKSLGNKIYGFCIPKIDKETSKTEKKKVLDKICIEWYYNESEIKKAVYEGKRIFLGNEFQVYDKQKRYSESKCANYITTKNNIKELDVLDEKVYKKNDENFKHNIALSKNDFVENVVDDLNIDNFKKIFHIIEKIIHYSKGS